MDLLNIGGTCRILTCAADPAGHLGARVKTLGAPTDLRAPTLTTEIQVPIDTVQIGDEWWSTGLRDTGRRWWSTAKRSSISHDHRENLPVSVVVGTAPVSVVCADAWCAPTR